MPGGQLASLTDGGAAQSPGRAGSAASAVMPRVELGGALADGVRGLSGIEQVTVLVEVEVFAHQREAQLTGEPAGSVPEPTGIGRSALVPFGVQHRGGQLRVMRP